MFMVWLVCVTGCCCWLCLLISVVGWCSSILIILNTNDSTPTTTSTLVIHIHTPWHLHIRPRTLSQSTHTTTEAHTPYGMSSKCTHTLQRFETCTPKSLFILSLSSLSILSISPCVRWLEVGKGDECCFCSTSAPILLLVNFPHPHFTCIIKYTNLTTNNKYPPFSTL